MGSYFLGRRFLTGGGHDVFDASMKGEKIVPAFASVLLAYIHTYIHTCMHAYNECTYLRVAGLPCGRVPARRSAD